MERERDYAGAEEGDAVAMVLAFGNVSHLLHWPAIGQYIPLAPEPLVAQEIEEPLRGNWQPNRCCGAEDDARRLARIIHALAGHDADVLIHIGGGELVPLVHCRSANTRAEVVRHPLR